MRGDAWNRSWGQVPSRDSLARQPRLWRHFANVTSQRVSPKRKKKSASAPVMPVIGQRRPLLAGEAEGFRRSFACKKSAVLRSGHDRWRCVQGGTLAAKLRAWDVPDGTRAEVCCALRRSGTCRRLRLRPEGRDWSLVRRRHVKGGNNDSRMHPRHGSSVPGDLRTWETGERGEKCGIVATQAFGGVGFEKVARGLAASIQPGHEPFDRREKGCYQHRGQWTMEYGVHVMPLLLLDAR